MPGRGFGRARKSTEEHGRATVPVRVFGGIELICLAAGDELQCGSRFDDGDALVAADGQQMLAVAGDDQPGTRSDGGGDHMIVIGIVGYHARYGGRRHQRHQCGVLREQ